MASRSTSRPSRVPRPSPERVRELAARAQVRAEDLRLYLESPAGRRLRHHIATGLIVSAPVIAQMPAMRATRVGRLVGAAGGAALIVRVAEAIRDWERSESDAAHPA